MSSSPTSQAVTPTDKLDKLMDELIASGRAYYDSWLEKDDAVRAARAALREYVSEQIEVARNEGFGRGSLWTGRAMMGFDPNAARRASMKEHPEQ